MQKVRLARALAQNPIAMLLDEPTTYLDSKKSILEVLANLKGKGVSIIFATHDTTEAAAISDYFILLQEASDPISGYKSEVFSEGMLSEIYSMGLRIVSIEEKQFIVTD